MSRCLNVTSGASSIAVLLPATPPYQPYPYSACHVLLISPPCRPPYTVLCSHAHPPHLHASALFHSFPAEPAAGLMHSQLAHSAAQYRGARQRRSAWVARQSGWQAAFAATDWAHPVRICTETGLTPPASASGLDSPLPHLYRYWGSSLPHLHRDWTHRCHICTGTGLTAATSAPGLGLTAATSAQGPGSMLPHLHPDWAHRCHICTGTGLNAATSAPGLGSPLAQLHRLTDSSFLEEDGLQRAVRWREGGAHARQ